MKVAFAIFSIVVGCFFVGVFAGASISTEHPPVVEPKVKAKPVRPVKSTKSKIKVMLIDTGVDLQHELLSGRVTGDGVDRHGHGTHIAGILLYGNKMHPDHGLAGKDQLCDEVEIISCKYYDPKLPKDNLAESVRCIELATKLKVEYLNYSGGGTEFSSKERKAYEEYLKSGGTAVVAAGNERSDLRLHKYYPASYGLDGKWKNFYVVENYGRDGERVPSSNYHPDAQQETGENILSTLPASTYGYMTGTSQATPAFLHTILKQKCESLNSKK